MSINLRNGPRVEVDPLGRDGGSTTNQRRARFVLVVALLAIGVWIANGYLTSLTWAALIATATWPLYVRYSRRESSGARRTIAAAIFTLLISAAIFGPLFWAGVGISREARSALHWVSEVQQTGVAPPDWLAKSPMFGERARLWWTENLADPKSVSELWNSADTGRLATVSRDIGLQIGDRLLHLLIMLIALFIFYRDGAWLGDRISQRAERWFGAPGRRLAHYMVVATRGVVNGLMVNALCVGSLITVAYIVAGVPYPLLFGAATIFLAMIPLGAWLAFSTASLALVIQGSNPWHAAILFSFGAVAMIISDNVTQPALVGGAAKLPFLAVLIGILGGLECFGLIGLFVGPILMAGLVFVWREWLDDGSEPHSETVNAG